MGNVFYLMPCALAANPRVDEVASLGEQAGREIISNKRLKGIWELTSSD
jgi:hypothetical protein